jgi:N-acetylglutamate synthase-like GNAT family acetyltransferase
MNVRRVEPGDRAWVAEVVRTHFASTRMVSRGRVYEDVSLLDGFIVEGDGRPIGLALWEEIEGDAELVVMVTLNRGSGAGMMLIDAVVDYAREHTWRRLWLITTNDNVDAIRFYQRAGWDWVAFYRNAVKDARALKPEIDEFGAYGLPILHEIEFEAPL